MAVPPDTPVTTPDPVPTVAMPELLLLHAPPAVPSLNAIVKDGHTTEGPVIPDGKGLTVTVVVITQPVAGKV